MDWIASTQMHGRVPPIATPYSTQVFHVKRASMNLSISIASPKWALTVPMQRASLNGHHIRAPGIAPTLQPYRVLHGKVAAHDAPTPYQRLHRRGLQPRSRTEVTTNREEDTQDKAPGQPFIQTSSTPESQEPEQVSKVLERTTWWIGSPGRKCMGAFRPSRHLQHAGVSRETPAKARQWNNTATARQPAHVARHPHCRE
ncbi:hypothetical protein HNP00_003911 [Arthrobacter sp. AZCC_0090]|nr:hypothetical protein [Arthrobacter sp. AZCC_0090]